MFSNKNLTGQAKRKLDHLGLKAIRENPQPAPILSSALEHS